jgi:multidrug efflux pump subunit AcrB
MDTNPTAPRLGLSGRIAAAFLRNSLTPLIALMLLLAGLFATLITPREEEPQINVTMANVFIPFPGASVRDVETLVARPAEEVLSRIAGLEHVYSVSRPGMAIMTVQYKVGEDATAAVVRLYDTIHSNSDWLPPNLGVLEPVVKTKGIDDVPIVALAFHGKDANTTSFQLQQVARAVEGELKRIPGTRDIVSIGGPGHVLRVELDPQRLNAHGLTVSEVAQALQVANVSAHGGSLVAGRQVIDVQAGAHLTNVREIKQLVVGVFDRKPVYLSQVAEISEGPDTPSNLVWHGTREGERPAVTLAVTKKPGVNAADVANAVVARAHALHGTVIPDDIEFTVTRDYGATATEKAQKLIGKLVFATAFVVLLVLFALGKREAVIVGAAVTLTLAATLFASWAWGFTLNRVSLFALIFSIGILVDDAIVVVENIHRWHLLHPDEPLLEIIAPAVDEVGGPTILATFTVIAALLPMAFVSGLMGPYMSPIPINASMGMFISLAIAFVVTPWLAGKLMKSHGHGTQDVADAKTASKLESLFRRIMTPLLDRATGKSARRKLWIGILAAILASVSLGYLKLVVLKMLPFDNKSEFQVVLDMPVGTPVEETARVLQSLADEVVKVPEVEHYQAYAGTASPINFNGLVRQYYLRAAPEMGDLQVNLVDKQHRSRQSHEIAVSVREAVQRVAKENGGNAKLVEVPPGPPVMSPIVAEVYGPDAAGREAVAREVRKAFEDTTDIVGVDDSIDEPAPRRILKINRARAAELGVAQRDVVAVIRTALAGEDATPLHQSAFGVGGDAKRPVQVRLSLSESRKSSLDDVLRLKVRAMGPPGKAGALVPLAELVTVETAVREGAVIHKDLLPVVFVTADMGGTLDSPLYGMFDIRRKLKDLNLDALPHAGGKLGEYFIRQPGDTYAGFAIKWDGEWQITYETFRDMGAAYAVGLILIYLLVVAQFRSYLVPLIIMAPIPLTLIGVMPGHALLGKQFTATSMIGMIALAGIIVRNSILLVDFINEQVTRGMRFDEAVIQAAAVRAKPIVLTALAAMLGALFILDDPIFSGLAISLIFGILVSTVLTLVVIPVLYYATYAKEQP